MSFEDNIQASVIDIRRDIPKSTDVFFLDTNVWYYYTTSYYSQLDPPWLKFYPSYISKVLHSKSKILRSELTLIELSSVIERTQYKIFIKKNGFSPDEIHIKDFRYKYPEERNNFIDELSMTWDTVKDVSESFDFSLDKSVSEFIFKGFYNSYLDGYDLLFVDLIQKKMRNPYILTNDKDFATFPDITVFTANNRIINAANEKDLLITR